MKILQFRELMRSQGRTEQECNEFFAEIANALQTKDIALVERFADFKNRVPENRRELFEFLAQYGGPL